MIPAEHLQVVSNLSFLDKEFETVTSTSRLEDSQFAVLFSKLAVLELSGWIESTIDEIFESFFDKTITREDYRVYLSNNVIKSCYGINYDRAIKPLIIKSLGAKLYQTFEDLPAVQQLQSILSRLHSVRDTAAHTDCSTQSSYDAPSKTKELFYDVYKVLSNIESWIDKLAKD